MIRLKNKTTLCKIYMKYQVFYKILSLKFPVFEPCFYINAAKSKKPKDDDLDLKLFFVSTNGKCYHSKKRVSNFSYKKGFL
jgi:hypothetical protein